LTNAALEVIVPREKKNYNIYMLVKQLLTNLIWYIEVFVIRHW